MKSVRRSTASMQPVDLQSVKLLRGLLHERQTTIRRHSLAHQHHQCQTTGRLDAFRKLWREGSTTPKPHEFWDSDVAKWIESAAYALSLKPDPDLENQVDAVIDLIAACQADDGYLNSYFQCVAPEKRWTNLRDKHELYCAGHLIEAAVAYTQATGKTKLLEVMNRYLAHIARRFGPAPDQKPGYCGHPEIELALMRLHQLTGDVQALQLATFFINQRGQSPNFFQQEAQTRGEDPNAASARLDYYQAHQPVAQQRTAEGHSVRAMYLFAGAADVAAATGDRDLWRACEKVFDNVVNQRMYITGGIGSTRHGERFTYDYDLPNESAYAETCAAIALAFFAQRMLLHSGQARYADVIERCLYNGILSGLSLNGKAYFYANYLATDQHWHRFAGGYPAHRQGWFGCACCPPNITRLLLSIGSYIYSHTPQSVYVNLYTASRVTAHIHGQAIQLTQITDYPWDDHIEINLQTTQPTEFTLCLRVPEWCTKPKLIINGKSISTKPQQGYLRLSRRWHHHDTIQLHLPMEIVRNQADIRVRQNVGRVALSRGPVVYCVESADVGPGVQQLVLPRDAKLRTRPATGKLKGMITLQGHALRETTANPTQPLYTPIAPRPQKKIKLTAIPYFAWANRTQGEMAVWLRQA